MTFAGVPILDWVLLVVLIGFGVEAYLTTRPRADSRKKSEQAEVSAVRRPGQPPD